MKRRKGEKRMSRDVDLKKEREDQTDMKHKTSTIKEKRALKLHKLAQRSLRRQIRGNLEHPDQPYAFESPEKKGNVTMFEALHSDGAGPKKEWLTAYERYSPEGKIH